MRTSLDHLPAHKQRELERVVQIIFEEFEDGMALATKDWKKRGRIDKVILYGSYARGGWVDEPHTSKGYRSDYDLMIIVTDQRLVEMAEVWAKLDERLMREYDITQTIKTPVNFIVHTISDVNDGLAHGRYFFMDIALDGIALYQREDSDFYKPRPKSSTQALEMAQEYFDDWFPSSMRKFKLAKDAREQDFPKESAFLLHQSVESLYHGILLVKTFIRHTSTSLPSFVPKPNDWTCDWSMHGLVKPVSSEPTSRSSRTLTSKAAIPNITKSPTRRSTGSSNGSRYWDKPYSKSARNIWPS
jgi:predicted nucleotidyltransferase